MRVIHISLLLLFCSALTFAQDGNRRGPQMDREKLQAARIAFLTNRLELSPETAKVFWPIFNDYDNKKSALSKKYGAQKRLLFEEGTRNISDENADKMLEIYLDQKQAELDLEKEYLSRFKEVLTLRQVWRVIRFDSDFRRSLMQRVSRGNRLEGKPKPDNTGGN
ncbi:hypothetical protein [Roseivirga sp. 4D4]|uniref:hypothetical protein n=1 Tax=Roseivirga sp. 4D4 TaxID=1889784 RepID=UPI000B1B2478|nr:hypothetical protein [Roseivirga sp. 4D4]